MSSACSNGSGYIEAPARRDAVDACRNVRRTKLPGLRAKQATGTRFGRSHPSARIQGAAFHDEILKAKPSPAYHACQRSHVAAA
jgi:hypothetical protein